MCLGFLQAMKTDRTCKVKSRPYLHLCDEMTEAGEGDPRFDRRRRHDWGQVKWEKVRYMASPVTAG